MTSKELEFVLPKRVQPKGVPDAVESVRHKIGQELAGLDDSKDWLVTVEPLKERRSRQQNRYQHLWHNEAAKQLRDETAEDKRAFCKLHFGVPILRAESDEFRQQYDRLIKPMPYPQKLELMKEPIDFPVTRLMTVEQKTRYLELIQHHYATQGVRLAAIEEGGYE